MSWVRRVPPGDPAYFCDCPPCPFCFEWVAEKADDAPRRRKRERPLRRKDASDSLNAEPRTMRRLLLPVLTGIAFVLTVGITMRHQRLPAPLIDHVPVLATLPVARREASPPLAARSDPPPAPAQSAAPMPASEPPAAPSDPGSDATTEGPAPEPARQEPLPVRLSVRSSPESGVSITLRNGSRAPLDLKVTAVDPSSGSQSMVAVNIPALTTVDLTRAGLVAEHGYQLRLESPGFVSREMMVQ